MRTLIKTISASVALIATSFAASAKYDFVGTYGVSKEDMSRVALTINDDHTFSFRDLSNPDRKIDVKGNWELKGHKVVFSNYTSPYGFHTKWKFKDDGKVARSRRGLNYYRICRL